MKKKRAGTLLLSPKTTALPNKPSLVLFLCRLYRPLCHHR
jgi:hypothetical protein